jgi:predicted nuclease with RNAse H fold
MTRTLGVDLASADRNTAAALVDWDDGPPQLVRLVDSNVSDRLIVELATASDVVAIDAPFGWPLPFARELAAYVAGEPWPDTLPEGLWYRLTDTRTTEIAGGRAPLSVSSDRIARPAERAARLLTTLGRDSHAAARDGSDGVIEVYPAGALRTWGIETGDYKRPSGAVAREQIVASLMHATRLVVDPETRAQLTAIDHPVDALVAALVGRAFALGLVHRPVGQEVPIARLEGWIHLPTVHPSELLARTQRSGDQQ